MRQFEIGKTYTHGWIGDAELFTSWTVIKRTAKTITITDEHGRKTRTCRIIARLSEMRGSESVFPFGQYSMAPILSAE